MQKLILLIFIALCSTAIYSQTQFTAPNSNSDLKYNKPVSRELGAIDGYLEHLPPGYAANPTKKYPLIVYLHGTGERGNGSTDLYKIARVGAPSRRVEENGKLCFTVNGVQECFIVISPQLNLDKAWTGANQKKFWEYIIGQAGYRIDLDRVYLTGHSLGGNGVWEAAYSDYNSPNMFAAIAPLSYWTNTSQVCKVADRKIAVWAFWGEKDYQFINQCKAAISTLKNCPRDLSVEIKTTEVPDAGHSITGPTYRVDNLLYNPNLYEWLLTKRRKSGSTTPTVPSTPGELKATTQSSSSIQITWLDKSTDEDGFKIERSLSSETGFTTVGSVSANNSSFTDKGLAQSITYFYRVRAYNISGNSAYSNQASATTFASSSGGSFIIWKNINGAVQIDNNLIKTASYGWGNSGAESSQIIALNSNGWIEMVIEDVSKTDLVFGLSDTNINDNVASTNFGFELSKYNRAFWVRENADRTYLGTYNQGDILRIERVGNTIIYKQNGQPLSTTIVTSTPSLKADVAFLATGATVFKGRVSTSFTTEPPTGEAFITWKNINGAELFDNNLIKTASYGWGNSGAESSQVIALNSDGWIEMIIEDVSKTDLVFGLSDTNINDNVASTDYGFELSKYNRAFWVRENEDRMYLGTYNQGDILRIERVGNTIIYKQNGQPISTTIVTSTPVLIADVAFLNTGATVFNGKISSSIVNSATSYVNWININGAVQNANNLVKTAEYGRGNSGAESSQSIGADMDGWIEIIITDTQKSDFTFGLSSNNLDDTPETINYGFEVAENNRAYWKRENTSRVYLGTYAQGDVLRVQRQGSTMIYKKNGKVVASTALTSKPKLVADASLFYTESTISQAKMYSSSTTSANSRSNYETQTEQYELSDTHQILIYPNPVGDQGQLNIRLIGYDFNHKAQFLLFTMSGELVFEQTLESVSTVIPLHHLSKSMYIYRLVLDGQEVKSGRILR